MRLFPPLSPPALPICSRIGIIEDRNTLDDDDDNGDDDDKDDDDTDNERSEGGDRGFVVFYRDPVSR
jgi:hypothetical protein